MDALFKILADETRLRILSLVSSGVFGVGEIAEALGLAQNLVSHHLRTLHEGSLIRAERQGRMVFYRFEAASLPAEAAPVVGHFLAWAAGQSPFADDRDRGGRVLGRRHEKSNAFFARHADRWDALAAAAVDSARSQALLDRFLPPQPAGVAADLGTGTGALVPWLSQRCARVIGVDASREMLDVAEAKHAGSRSEFRLGELEHLPIPDGAVDVAVLHYVLHHCARPEAVFPEVRRVLQPEGRIILIDFLPHREERFRAEMGDVWLGLPLAEVEALLAASCLQVVEKVTFPSPNPQVTAFALWGRRGE